MIDESNTVIIAGGGAAGCFAAITCKENAPHKKVILIEKSEQLLSKVSLSGGGRCNCTNSKLDKNNLNSFYPRGAKFLRAAFSQFDENSTISWFESKGIALKTESDGRIFPKSDKSSTITDLIECELEKNDIEIIKKNVFKSATQLDNNTGFKIVLDDDQILHCQNLCITTGGSANSSGITSAIEFGHQIEDQIPSLFSFHINDSRLNLLPGISVQDASVTIIDTKYSVKGGILITHNGISGPAVIKLSSYCARIMHSKNHEVDCRINWCPEHDTDYIYKSLDNFRKEIPKKIISIQPAIKLPSRLWKMIVLSAGCGEQQQWAHLTAKQKEMIVQNLTRFTCHISGRAVNKDEFVTCGGISCSQINASTMESRITPGLFFAGEVIDIDGITGGYNLQAAWSTGWIAGKGMADKSGRRVLNL